MGESNEKIQVTVHIPGLVPSKKNRHKVLVNKRTGKPFVRSDEKYQVWENEQLFRLRANKELRKVKKPIKRCSIRIDFIGWDNRAWDLTNKAESIMDLLVRAEVIADDNWQVVRPLVLDMLPKGEHSLEPGALVHITY